MQSSLVALSSSSSSDDGRGDRDGGDSRGSQAAFTAAAAVRLHVRGGHCIPLTTLVVPDVSLVVRAFTDVPTGLLVSNGCL